MAGRSVINVLVNADTRDFVGGMDKASRKIGGFVSGGVKNLAKLGAAFGAVGAVAAGAFAKSAISAAEDMATANDRIRQISESMGLFGAQTEAVSGRLIGLANDMALVTGVSQNTIKESQALLLTFAEIASSADEVGGAFDRATQLTVDMAAAGFGSATDNAKQLGKALQDPIKGISALTRSGVTFSEQQKDLIKTLVESGQMLEAQDMILSAIEEQVGGTAEATANASDKIRVGFSQVMERFGVALLPVFERLTKFLLNKVFPTLEKIGAAFGEDGLAGAFKVLGDTLLDVGRVAFRRLRDWAGDIARWFVTDAAPAIADKAVELGAALVDWIEPRIGPALQQLREWLSRLGNWFVDTALPYLGEKAAEWGAALWEWVQTDGFDAISKLATWLGSVGRWFIDTALPYLGEKAAEWAVALWEWIKTDGFDAISKLATWLGSIGRWFINTALPYLGNKAKQWAPVLWEWIDTAAGDVISQMAIWLNSLADYIKDDLKDDLGVAMASLVDALWSWISGREADEATDEAAKDLTSNFADAFVKELVPAMARVNLEIYNAVVEGLGDAFKQAGRNAAGDYASGLKGGGFGRILDLAGRLPFGGSDITPGFDIPGVPGLAKGGIVTGPTLALIGEAGPEAVVPLSSPNAPSFGSGMTINVNMPAGSNGEDVVRAIRRYARNTGTLPIPVTDKVRT